MCPLVNLRAKGGHLRCISCSLSHDNLSSALNGLSKAIQLQQTSQFHRNQHLHRVITLSDAVSHHFCYTEWVISGAWFKRDRDQAELKSETVKQWRRWEMLLNVAMHAGGPSSWWGWCVQGFSEPAKADTRHRCVWNVGGTFSTVTAAAPCAGMRKQ